MTRAPRPPATRAAVLRHVHRLEQVRKAAAVLTRKRKSLIEELLARARTAMKSRETLDARARQAWRALWYALADCGSDALTPLGWPTREVDLHMSATEVWGVHVAQLMERPTLVRSIAARGVLAGPGDAASQDAAREFELLLEQLLDIAPQEQAVRRLSNALSRTTRLVNTLEQRVAVTLMADLAAMRSTLAEREREEHLRIKHLILRRRAATLT